METRLDNEKAERWSLDPTDFLGTGTCSAALAGKFAGRFPWAVTMQNYKIGKACAREWHMATNDALPQWELRYWHRLSCCWWMEYLNVRPRAVHWSNDVARRHAIMWTDAAGGAPDGWLR